MTEKDPVMIDEAKHDRMQTAQEMLEAEGMEQAMDEFKGCELDDDIRKLVIDEPINATDIALWACYPEHFLQPACSMKDFRATVQGVIDRQAQWITENK
jgi:hypothetical protein